MPLIIPSNSISGEFEVANSLRFNDGSSDSLNRTNTSSGSRKVFTFSCWFKKSTLGLSSDDQMIFSSWDGSNGIFIQIDGSDLLQIYSKVGGVVKLNVRSEMVFRDVSAWYHIVVKFDSNSTNLDLYVNGEEISQTVVVAFVDADHEINESGGTHYIGTKPSDRLWDGYMAEVVFIDGTALDPTSFGEFDEDSGIWKPISVSGLTFGTNGFYLDFENSGSLGNDKSGNGNNFTVNNLTSIDQTTDTPTNNFATWNPLTTLKGNNSSLSNGNTTLIDTGTTDTDGRNYSTIGASSGKWYFEIKASAFSNNNHTIGVSFSDGDVDANSNDSVRVRYTTSNNTNYIRSFGTIVQSNLTSFSAGSIIGVAVDLDNGTVQFYVNGSTYGSQVTGLSGSIANKTMFVQSYGEGGSGRTFTLDANFGNPPFTISSGNSDGNGYGNFEYAVPNGYFSLNSKNLSEFG